MSMIEELYFSDIRPTAIIYTQGSPVPRMVREKGAHLDKLMESMGRDEKKLCEKYCSVQADGGGAIQYDQFVYALRSGILLMMEIFAGEDDLPREGEGKREDFHPA